MCNSFVKKHFELDRNFHTNNGLVCANYFNDLSQLNNDCTVLSKMISKYLSNNKEENQNIKLLAGGICGINIAILVSNKLNELFELKIPVIVANKIRNKFTDLNPPFKINEADKIIIINENALRGNYLESLLKIVEENKGIPIVIGVLIDRRKILQSIQSINVISVYKLGEESYDIELDQKCPDCLKGYPVRNWDVI